MIREYEATLKTTQEYANQFLSTRRRLIFTDKDRRDQVAAELKKAGVSTRKSVESGITLHPEYIADWQGYVETGFGNTMYQTTHRKLYFLSPVLIQGIGFGY